MKIAGVVIHDSRIRLAIEIYGRNPTDALKVAETFRLIAAVQILMLLISREIPEPKFSAQDHVFRISPFIKGAVGD